MKRILCKLGIVMCLGLVLSGCTLVAPPPPMAQVSNVAAVSANAISADMTSEVTDGAGPITAADPVQAQAEAEFRAVAIAKEQAFYAGDAERFLSFYADDVISVQPGMPVIVGKAALAEGYVPYLENNRIVGKFVIKQVWFYGDHAIRLGEWEEVVTPLAGGKSERHIGRCILNWEKVDGEWKVVSEFVNYLVPPTEFE